MKNSSLNIDELDSLIESCLSEHWLVYSINQVWLRSSVAANPLSVLSYPFLNLIRIEEVNKRSLIFYILFRFYHPVEEYRYLMLLELERQLEKNPEFYWMSSILSYKSLFLNWLLSTNNISYRSFVSLLKDQEYIHNLQKSINFFFQTNKEPKRVQRHRGYRDKGTLPNRDLKIIQEEFKKDFTTRELIDSINSKRELSMDTISLLEGFLM